MDDRIEELIQKRNELNEQISVQAIEQIEVAFKSIISIIDGTENLVVDKHQHKSIKKHVNCINNWLGGDTYKSTTVYKVSLSSKQKTQIVSKMNQHNYNTVKSAVGRKLVLKLIGVEKEIADLEWADLEKNYGLVRKEGRGPAAYWCRKKK